MEPKEAVAALSRGLTTVPVSSRSPVLQAELASGFSLLTFSFSKEKGPSGRYGSDKPDCGSFGIESCPVWLPDGFFWLTFSFSKEKVRGQDFQTGQWLPQGMRRREYRPWMTALRLPSGAPVRLNPPWNLQRPLRCDDANVHGVPDNIRAPHIRRPYSDSFASTVAVQSPDQDLAHGVPRVVVVGTRSGGSLAKAELGPPGVADAVARVPTTASTSRSIHNPSASAPSSVPVSTSPLLHGKCPYIYAWCVALGLGIGRIGDG